MSGDVITTIRESVWILAPIGLLLTLLTAFLGGSWAGRGIFWTFALTRTRQLKSLQKQQARLEHLHDTGGISGWLLSGIFWVLFLFGVQLTLESMTAAQLTMSPPPVQVPLPALLNASRYIVGFTTVIVSINRLKWYRRLEYYDTTKAFMDRAIAKLEAKQAVHQPPVTA